ncbi:uncharacterized protein LOC124372543 isoform X2 [Homalodisca vitripennis]|uniref:uncharacterized protein LOC124372543 isoform X2 n=1 Tax=Homalodisca vitripennis TaxID=197043 RepID=UPI001EEC59BC|nr:uncharacterized protein LOC124372543 isoform X2 [Homalodisca vitripennis]
MASVQSSKAGKYARRGMPEDEAPEHVESTGELLIKQLVQKQTNTNVTLRQQLQQKKEFERGVGFVTLDEMGLGTSSLQEFEEKQRKIEKMLEMERRGQAREKMRSSQIEEQLIKASGDSQFSLQGRAVRRQELELALSVKPDSLETRLYQFALRGERVCETETITRLPGHPIHQLAAMEKNLVESADPQALARTYRRKRRQLVTSQAQPQGAHNKAPDRQQSLWDATESPVVVEKRPRLPQKVVSCKKQAMYTVRDGKIVQLSAEHGSGVDKPASTAAEDSFSGQVFVALQPSVEKPQVCDRLTEEEIRKLPRFHNYKQGEVSKCF